MFTEDIGISVNVIKIVANDSEIPLSELIRKEFFHKCFTSFTSSLGAEPALFAD
jgi:hypothetical protein